MRATISSAQIREASIIFAGFSSLELDRFLTRALKKDLDEASFQVRYGKALASALKGVDSILDLPQDLAEEVFNALSEFYRFEAVFCRLTEDQSVRFLLRPGAQEAADALMRNHGAFLVFTPQEQAKLKTLGQTREERTVVGIVWNEDSDWNTLMRAVMGYIESIELVAL
jgi:hypothetical protein